MKSWLQLVHERNTLVRKQDELNSLQNEEHLEEKCCAVMKEIRKYKNMRGEGCFSFRNLQIMAVNATKSVSMLETSNILN